MNAKSVIQPAWLRLTHWVNAIAVVLMAMSGWRIYNASPIYPLVFPAEITLGGWLAGALYWHFFAMWILCVNGVAYLLANGLTGRLWQRFFPLRWNELKADLWAAMRGRLSHADLARYNAPQKGAYLFAMADIALLIVSGLVLWKSVQFPLLRELLGGYDMVRKVHFYAMWGLLGFVAVHVLLVLLVPRSMLLMVRGR